MSKYVKKKDNTWTTLYTNGADSVNGNYALYEYVRLFQDKKTFSYLLFCVNI